VAFILDSPSGGQLHVNKWNWHPTVELMARAGLITRERAEHLHYNCGGEITADEALQIAGFLNSYVRSMSPGDRLLIDGKVTGEPDTFELHRGEDWDKNYSATLEWLQKFQDFCATCGGFSVL
jgi:hypothetical protein